MGGLRPGTREIMDAAVAAQIRQHWEHVVHLTGQTVNYDFFKRQDFIYDTEPASRAIVAMRLMHPGLSFSYLEALQRAFYQKNVDITREENLLASAAELGVATEVFSQRLHQPATRMETLRDFYTTRQMGVRGFPAVLAIGSQGSRMLAEGYRPFAELEGDIEDYLRNV